MVNKSEKLVTPQCKLHAKSMRLALIAAAILALTHGVFAESNSSGPVIAEIAKQFDRYPLIMIGELHRWEQLHAFIQEMIRNPAFICRADDIVVEFGNSRLQQIADTYAFGGDVTEAQLQSLWRETAVPLTWNSPLYRQFYETVREINQKHLCDHQVRIVLADPPLDWAKIRSAKDYKSWTDRDASYAKVVEREVLARNHRAFLLAGMFHVVKSTPTGDEDGPRAAQLIEQKHPGALFSIAAVSPSVAETMHLGPAPGFKVIRGSDLQDMDFEIISKIDPPKKWPPINEVIDGLLYVGEQSFLYPPPSIYLEPAFQRELRRRAAIIKAFSGQDFIAAIDELVREARKDKR